MRIIGHMVVGPGESDRYLIQVLERAYLWADVIHVALDADATQREVDDVIAMADAWQQLEVRWADHEAVFRQAAWESMELAFYPTDEDYILVFDADEVVHDYAMVKKAARMYAGKRIGFTFHEMWSPTQYRIDRLWKPYPAWIMFPYRRGGRFQTKKLACGREPTYVGTLPRGPVVADVLHYGYAKPEDRQVKYDRYMALDGGKYHNMEHIRSILYDPSLAEWGKGGLLRV